MQQLAAAVTNSGAGVTMTFSTLTNSFTVVANEHGSSANLTFGGTDTAILTALGLNHPVLDRLIDNPDTTAGAPPKILNPAYNDNSIPGFRIGTNLEVEINGQRVETASNSVSVDGTTFTFAAHATPGEFRAEVGSNPGAAFDAIKSFVDSYNSLVRDITLGMLTERPSKGHHFLTEWDIEELKMTETQQSQWNTMASKGMLYNNRTVSSIMANMRNAMNSIVGGFGLHSIMGNDGTHALRPSQNWREMGQLELNEQALREALERDPEKITQLFTGENGIMANLQGELNRALNTMGPESTHGTLVRRAGMPTGASSTRNALQERIKSINDSINIMQARHDRQQERFWKMFTNMERQFASLNSQSDQINGFFMGMFG